MVNRESFAFAGATDENYVKLTAVALYSLLKNIPDETASGTYRRFAAEAGVPEVVEQSHPVEMFYRAQHLCWRMLPQPLFAFAARAMYEYFFRSHYGV